MDGRVKCLVLSKYLREELGDYVYTDFIDRGDGMVECYIPGLGFSDMHKSLIIECVRGVKYETTD